MILLIDNYDSFVYNVYQQLSELGAIVDVRRNDEVTIAAVNYRKYRGIVISPGPGVPSEAGISEDMIREFQGKLPILGICLGQEQKNSPRQDVAVNPQRSRTL